jgi:hypothetical protein
LLLTSRSFCSARITRELTAGHPMLEAAGDKPVLGIDSTISAFGTLCLVPGNARRRAATGRAYRLIGFEPFGGGESGFETRWSKRGAPPE